jgi:hypothetical protein
VTVDVRTRFEPYYRPSAMRVRSAGRPVGGDMGVFRHRSCLAHALPRCAHIGRTARLAA